MPELFVAPSQCRNDVKCCVTAELRVAVRVIAEPRLLACKDLVGQSLPKRRGDGLGTVSARIKLRHVQHAES